MKTLFGIVIGLTVGQNHLMWEDNAKYISAMSQRLDLARTKFVVKEERKIKFGDPHGKEWLDVEADEVDLGKECVAESETIEWQQWAGIVERGRPGPKRKQENRKTRKQEFLFSSFRVQGENRKTGKQENRNSWFPVSGSLRKPENRKTGKQEFLFSSFRVPRKQENRKTRKQENRNYWFPVSGSPRKPENRKTGKQEFLFSSFRVHQKTGKQENRKT